MAQASRKAPKKKASRRSKPTPGWVWLLAGLGIGLTVALFTYVKDHKLHIPTAKMPSLPPKHEVAKQQDHKPPTKPKFDFYTILPEMEIVVPDTQNKAGQTNPIDKPGTYILQAGSFRSFAEADHLKAQLALLGVESKIEQVTVNNKDTWQRVRVGPTQDLRELNKIRTRLLNNNINPILLRVNN